MTRKRTKPDRRTPRPTRFNGAEWADVRTAAQFSNLSPSAYVRHAALQLPLTIKFVPDSHAALIAQLKAIGNNLNQIAQATHRGRDTTTGEYLAATLGEIRNAARVVIDTMRGA